MSAANAGAGAQDAPALVPADYDPAIRASLLLSYVIGRWHRFVRSGFVRLPADEADPQLRVILQ